MVAPEEITVTESAEHMDADATAIVGVGATDSVSCATADGQTPLNPVIENTVVAPASTVAASAAAMIFFILISLS